MPNTYIPYRSVVPHTRDAGLTLTQIAIRKHQAETCRIYRLPGESIAAAYERLFGHPTIKQDVRDEAIYEALSRGVAHDIIAFATHTSLRHVRELAAQFEVEAA